MGAQEAKGQGPGKEEASLCFRGKHPAQVWVRDGVGNHCARGKQPGWRGLGYPKGGLLRSGEGLFYQLTLLHSNSEIGFLTPKLKSRKNLKTQQNGTTFGLVISLLRIFEKTVQHVEKYYAERYSEGLYNGKN